MKRTRIDWIPVIIAISFAVGCSGGGCGGCAGIEPIPGGFPAAERQANAGQVRVTSSAIAKIKADPAAVFGGFVGGSSNGVITFDVPPSCGGSVPICCPGGQPSNNCGPINIDLVKRASDPARLDLTPQSGASRLDVTLRARVKTVKDLIITIAGNNCTVHLNTDPTPAAGSTPDLIFSTQVTLPLAGGGLNTTQVIAANTSVTLEDSDYSIGGDLLCGLGSIIPRSVVEDQIASLIQNQINAATCKQCPGGTVAECGSPAATKCNAGTCEMANGACFQELGIAGRLRGSTLFSSLSPGTTGALDLYEVAGGYATTNNGGIALGLLGGMLPGGSPRDMCGPAAAAPADATIAQTGCFQGNTCAELGGTGVFDVGIGLHKSQLDQLAWAGYQGGLFCLTIGSSTVAQLSTDTISLLSRSLGTLVESNSPMSVGLRPQSPPEMKLGKNTFKDDGSGTMVPDEPLIDLKFKGLELDFFASIDDQYNRVFTVVTDVHLPIGLQTSAMGQLTPVIGNPPDAFTNIVVKNSEAITESPAEIAGLFPTLLNLVVPQLSSGLPSFGLPTLGGLALDIKAVTAIDFEQFLAIFADLVPAAMQKPVDTTAELGGVIEPSPVIARDVSKWRTERPPQVQLVLGGSAPDLEFSWRTNGGAWSGWSQNRRPTVSTNVFWLPGLHKLDVRARRIGHPETIDPTPVEIELAMGTDLASPEDKRPLFARADFHGQAGASGCSCETSSPTGGILLALAFGLLLVPRRRLRKLARRLGLRGLAREALRLGPIVWIAAIASLPGCSCGNPCGDADCLPGEVERGAVGRFTSIAADSKRVLVATYDQGLGDLVVVDATDRDNMKYVVVDGIPDITPTHDPDSYRGGIEDAGPNVGAWTSIQIASGGLGMVAYQDRDESALKYAYETSANHWKNYVVDTGDAVTGQYASLAIDGQKKPAIAYLALGIDDGAGHRVTELRLARAKDANPTQASEWTTSVIASAPGSCAGLCGGGQSCVAGAMATDPQLCATATTDCTATCADTEACVMGACRAIIAEPKVVQPPLGTGLYVTLVTLPDGRLAATYYDQTRRALVIAAEGTVGGSDFTETVLDGNAAGADRGIWATAAVGGDGTVHIAYQDALGDQLMYTSWNNAPGTPVVVDDGQRANDRTHPVGAGGAIYVDGGEPAIVYQDGLVSNVRLATRAGGTWTHSAITDTPKLDGFSIGATTGKGSPVFAWGTIDPTQTIPGSLTVAVP